MKDTKKIKIPPNITESSYTNNVTEEQIAKIPTPNILIE